ncbi:MAG: SpoIID/LytB domain-containing protein [Clostridiales bacterium]|nr:SpoIID/LytB domain-containing protein [Clostridiales bacterium]
MKKLLAAFLSATVIFSGMGTTAFAATEIPDYIRVGLRSNYEEKDSISIESTNIKLVRSDDGVTSPLLNETMAEFSSSSGFNVRVGLSYQVAIPISVSTFADASAAASLYISNGYSSAVAGYYKNNWAVLIYGYSDWSSASSAASSLGGTALSPTDVTILNIDGSPILLMAESDNYFMGTGDTPVVDLGARSYRGIIDFMNNGDGTITAVNVIDVEEYLYGVVPSEIPSTYEYESIKAQACAARTYALYKWNLDSDIGYDICDTTHCQAYMGYDYESTITTQAVIDTAGELIYYNGSPIEALFFSSSGGYTEDAENVWGTNVPYLKAVDDSQEINCPTWTRTITLSDLNTIIAAEGYSIGSATGMRITIDNTTSRVQMVEIIGTSGTQQITLEECRTVFSALGSSFSSRHYTITNGTVESSDGEVSYTVNANLGTFVSEPLEDFVKGSDYVIGADCAVVYSTSSGTKAYGYDGEEIDLSRISDLEKYLTVSSSTGTTVISSSGSTINISGYGVGHGVGMSQMGANGMAQNGADYKEILEHYYTGCMVE